MISDTHISREGERLPPQIKQVFGGVDLILHGGDIYILSVLDQLEEIAPVLAARGNGDGKLPQDSRLKEAHVLQLNGFCLGLTHGIDYPEPPWGSLEATMRREFGGIVDIIVFGDTHVPLVETRKVGARHPMPLLLVNPGSPTFPWNIQKLGTVALLELNPGDARAQVIQL